MSDMPRGEMTAPPTSATEMPAGRMQREDAAEGGATMPQGNGSGEMPAGTMPNVG